MSVIPTISVTEEHFSDDVAEEATESTGLNINDVHTDIENLDSDTDTKTVKKKSVSLGIKKAKCDALTDVEDMNDSGSEAEEEKAPVEDIKISLEEFLDQAYVEEATKFSGHKQHMSDAPPKTKKVSSSNILGVDENDKGAVTDCENLNASDDDECESGNFSEEYDKAIVLEGPNTVEAHDSVKNDSGRFPQSPIHLTTTGESTSSSEESQNEARHLKISHKKGCKSKKDRAPVSDTENIMFSDGEVQKKKILCRKLPLILDGWEEVTIQLSDGEDDSVKTPMYPEIDITFAEAGKQVNKLEGKKKQSLLKVDEVDDGLTDVENLNSSDDDDEDDQVVAVKRQLIPPAVAKSKVGFLTDTEDIDDVESELDDTPEIPLPTPTRELVEVREDRVRKQIIRPACGELLGLTASYVDKGLTDIEDLSDVEDNDSVDNIAKYTIDKTPDLDTGNVYVSEKVTSATNLVVSSKTPEPLTDTEDLCQTGQIARRRKNKHRTCGRGKQKHLDVKSQNVAGGTDVEELEMSDTECSKETKGVRRQKKGRTSIAVPVIVSNDGGKTDVEYVSADDFPPEYEGIVQAVDTNSLMGSDTFVSTVSDTVGGYAGRRKTAHHVPVIRKVSLTVDGVCLPHTDTEDLAVQSDQDDETYSRAQTATPFEIHQALDDASSTIHDKSLNTFDVQTEKLNIKGHRDCQEVYTDVEYMEDEARKE